jgi:hypothetical protein
VAAGAGDVADGQEEKERNMHPLERKIMQVRL